MRNASGKTCRAAVFLAAALALVVLLVSAFYIVAEADHECSGDDCPVCAGLRRCENNLEQILGGSVERRVVCALSVLAALLLLRASCSGFSAEPQSAMVRLNN